MFMFLAPLMTQLMFGYDYQGNNNSSAYRGNPTYNTGSSSNNATNITEWVQGNTSAGIRFSHTTH